MVVTSEASYVVMCSSKKYPYPPPATEGNGNSEGRGVRKEANSEGRGVRKEAISEEVGVDNRGFFFRESEYSLRTADVSPRSSSLIKIG